MSEPSDGLKRIIKISHREQGYVHTPELEFDSMVEMMKEMAEALEFCSQLNIGYQATPFEISNKAKEVLQKFKEWK